MNNHQDTLQGQLRWFTSLSNPTKVRYEDMGTGRLLTLKKSYIEVEAYEECAKIQRELDSRDLE